MSKRGSKSTKFIGNKPWNENNNSPNLNKNLKNKRDEIKKIKWETRFRELSIELNCTNFDSFEYVKFKNIFLNDFSLNERLLAMTNICSFKDYCIRENLNCTLNLFIDELYCFYDYNNLFEELLSVNPYKINTTSELVDFEIKIKHSKYSEVQKTQLFGCLKFLYKKV